MARTQGTWSYPGDLADKFRTAMERARKAKGLSYGDLATFLWEHPERCECNYPGSNLELWDEGVLRNQMKPGRSLLAKNAVIIRRAVLETPSKAPEGQAVAMGIYRHYADETRRHFWMWQDERRTPDVIIPSSEVKKLARNIAAAIGGTASTQSKYQTKIEAFLYQEGPAMAKSWTQTRRSIAVNLVRAATDGDSSEAVLSQSIALIAPRNSPTAKRRLQLFARELIEAVVRAELSPMSDV